MKKSAAKGMIAATARAKQCVLFMDVNSFEFGGSLAKGGGDDNWSQRAVGSGQWAGMRNWSIRSILSIWSDGFKDEDRFAEDENETRDQILKMPRPPRMEESRMAIMRMGAM